MKTLTADINLDEEVAHLAEFIGQKWTPITGMPALFAEIRAAAFHAARGWFDQHAVWEFATDLEDTRAKLLASKLNLGFDASVEYYDSLCTLLSDISRSAREVREAGMALDGEWYFERRVRAVERQVVSKYPDLASARPLGWAELEKGYCDFDGQAEYDPYPDRDLFNGVRVEGTLSSDFPGRVALPYVMYDEKCQGFKASSVLVGSVFAHFLGIAEFLNTHKLKQDLLAALPNLPEPVMLFERNLQTDNPFLKVMFELAKPCRTKASFEESLAQRAEFEALSDEEKAQRRAGNNDAILQILAELKRTTTAEEDQRYAAEKEHRITLLRAALD
ncbi:hypothetical protein [Burkholderia ubonensis]|uniref:hypothetical protein n=1 Tax=Burkholderia ubonensis TaxID=101571 RepID=UPI00075B7311|nr:hypothetical protein [Burkholderia ubonensis]KVP17054.1 hypothetical protein WJ84_01910 [Burkholderia ubonensis]